MDRTATPAKYWLLCLLFVCFLLNCLATQALNWENPIQHTVGQCPDISSLLQYHWFEPVYHLDDHNHHSYPSKCPKKQG